MYVLYMQWCLGASSLHAVVYGCFQCCFLLCMCCTVICGAATLLLLLHMCVLPQCCFCWVCVIHAVCCLIVAIPICAMVYSASTLLLLPCVCVVCAVVYSASTLLLALYMYVLYGLWYAVLPHCCYR